MSTVVTVVYNVITVTYIQASIIKWTCQRSYWRCSDISMRVILQIWCQIHRTSSSLRCVNCAPGHIQRNYSSAYSGFNIQMNITVLLFEISRQFNARYNANLLPNTAHVLQLTLCELCSRDIQCNYISVYSGFNIQLNVTALLEIFRHFDARYTAIFGVKHCAPPIYAMLPVVPDIYNVITVTYIQASIFNWMYLSCYWIYVDNSMSVILQIWCQI
jgi:hypothetical protein